MNLRERKLNIIKILKNDGVGVMPTDTLYGLVGSVFSKKAINRIYKIKKRSKKKKFIILISSINDLKKFGINLPLPRGSVRRTRGSDVLEILKKFWPGKVSIVLNNIAFRLPKNKKLLNILKQTGPLIAPSANPEGLKPAENITQAKKYFGDKVDFYLSGGTLKSKPSTLIKIENNGKIKKLR